MIALITQEIAGLGYCNVLDVCPDKAYLETYRMAAIAKSQALESVCVECYILDAKAAFELNNRPRKSLNWLTPAQVLAGITNVALRT